MKQRFLPMCAWVGVLAMVATAAMGSVGPAPRGDRFDTYSGTATAERSDGFLYRENHVLRYRDGVLAERVVLYTCRDGAPFARKTVSYAEGFAPDFVLDDASNGMREGIRTQSDVRQVFFRGDRAASEKSAPMANSPDTVADTGFDLFVRKHWQALVEGHSVAMNFVVPSRLQSMGFKVRHIRDDRVEGVPAELFRLELAGVLGLVVPSIDVYYTAADHVLVRYVGLSDLRDAAGNNYKARIVFPPADRKPGDEASLTEAREARLAPCK